MLTYRPAAVEDAAAVAALLRPLAEAFVLDPASEEAAPFWASVDAAAQRGYIASSRYRYTLAVAAGGALAGFIALRDGRHLFHLFVAPVWQRQGLAARLWRQALAADAAVAAAGGGAPVVFTVNASLPAVGFYRRLGFMPVGAAVAAHGIGFQPMRLSLPPA